MPKILVCGYRRTGKDALAAIMSGQHIPARFKWRIYARDKTLKLERDLSCKRIAFADELKAEASAVYSIPLGVPDEQKDIKQFIHYKTKWEVSARDIYIEWGNIRRNEDIDYWCRAAFESIDESDICIVTDWRFPNEKEYTFRTFKDTVTVRVYRSDVPEPDANIESEHKLDDFQTDFLLIRDDFPGEFERTCSKFPQYKDYIPTGVL